MLSIACYIRVLMPLLMRKAAEKVLRGVLVAQRMIRGHQDYIHNGGREVVMLMLAVKRVQR